MTDTVDRQTQQGIHAAAQDRTGSAEDQSHQDTQGAPNFLWKSKEPWKKVGMSKNAWYKAGRPAEKPVNPRRGGTVIPKALRRQRSAQTQRPKRTTPQAQAIRDTVKKVYLTEGKVTLKSVKAACKVKGIAATSQNNLHYHINRAANLGDVPHDALDMQPRARMSESLLNKVVWLATPKEPEGTMSVPQITAAMEAEGLLEKDATTNAKQECVRRYVKEAIKRDRIKPEWIVSGHRSEKREEIKALTPTIVQQYAPVNVRGIFYKLVDKNIVLKENVKNELARLSDILVEQREDDIIDADDIVDIRGTVHHDYGWANLMEGLQFFVEHVFRVNLWTAVEDRVVIGVEKAGLGDVIKPVCDRFQAPLIVAGGFGSYTLAKDTAKEIARHNGKTYVYYFGDHGPSGLCIDDSFERRLRQLVHKMAPEAYFEFDRVGLRPEHIRQYGLSTHKVNPEDRRAEKFIERYGNEAADLDALDPNVLRSWVEKAIRRHILQEDLDRAERKEAWDREFGRQWIEQLKRSRL